MVDVKKVMDLLIKHEDIKLYPYKDTVGKLTIGVGRNLDDRGISKKEALYLAVNDMNSCIEDLQDYFDWFNAAPEKVQLVLIDMCFNMGIGTLLQFKNTLELIRTGKYEEASKAMLDSLWAKQVGNRAIEDSNILKG